MSKPLEGGASTLSKKAHLLKVWEQTGRMPGELGKVYPVPESLFYLWEWLSDQVYPLSYVELEAWQRLTKRKLSLWEIRALIELDKVRSYG